MHDAGGGAGGLITVAYQDAFIRHSPVAVGGSGLQRGAAGTVYLKRSSSFGDVHSKVSLN